MLDKIPPRERQVVDLLYARGPSTVAELCEELPDALSASAVRAMLTRLQNKKIVRREDSDRGFLYMPAVAETAAKQSALKQVVRTFFGGSPVGAATALLGMSDRMSEDELDDLEKLIAKARQERTS